MAELVGGFIVPHVPLILSEPNSVSPEESARVYKAFGEVADRLRALNVDTVIIIGGDHYGLFGPGCIPQCLIGIGDVEGPWEPWLPVEKGPLPTNQPLAKHLLDDGHNAGVDWSFANALSIDHAVMLPYHLAVKPAGEDIRVIPVYLNQGAMPVIRSQRAYEIGQQLGDSIRNWEGAGRVAILGTGGISHWVGMQQMGQVNEEFDHRILKLAEAGDVQGLIDIPDDEILETAGNGALEIKAWMCAMGAIPGCSLDLIAYEPVPGWVCGFGFGQLKMDGSA